jgi:hypothetical protein
MKSRKQLYYETNHDGLVKVKDPTRVESTGMVYAGCEEWEVTVVEEHYFFNAEGVKLVLYPAGYKITTLARYLVHKAGYRQYYQMVKQADLP